MGNRGAISIASSTKGAMLAPEGAMQYSEMENSHTRGAQDRAGEQRMKTKVKWLRNYDK